MDIVALCAFAVLFLLVILILIKLYSAKTTDLTPQMLDLKNELNELKTKQLENQQAFQGNITRQLDNSSRTIGEIHTKLGALETQTKHIQEIGKDISSFKDILQSPKLRGNFGEYMLENLLEQIIPANYEPKYNFKNGTQVDAIIKLGSKIVPVDSKFPLDSFKRLVSAGSEEDKKSIKKNLFPA
jgi:DNA recombination protein RmuC